MFKIKKNLYKRQTPIIALLFIVPIKGDNKVYKKIPPH